MNLGIVFPMCIGFFGNLGGQLILAADISAPWKAFAISMMILAGYILGTVNGAVYLEK